MKKKPKKQRKKRKAEFVRPPKQGGINNRVRIERLEAMLAQLIMEVKNQLGGMARSFNEWGLKTHTVLELLIRAVLEGPDTLTDEERAALEQFADGEQEETTHEQAEQDPEQLPEDDR